MQPFDYLVEQALAADMQRGDFDNLPGTGKPFTREDDSMVPDELRMAYRILKNPGFVPPEVIVRKETGALTAEIITCKYTGSEKAPRKLRYLYICLAGHGSSPVNLTVHDACYERCCRNCPVRQDKNHIGDVHGQRTLAAYGRSY